MNKLLICSHGSLSKGLFSSLNIIMGDVENVDYLTFYENGEGAAQLEKIENYFKENKMIKDVPNGLIVRTVISNIGGYVMLKYIFDPDVNYNDEKELKYIEELIVNAFSL